MASLCLAGAACPVPASLAPVPAGGGSIEFFAFALAALCTSALLMMQQALPFPEAEPDQEGYLPEVGETVLVGATKVPAVVHYVGHTSFADGEWIGVEFAEAYGKNDGSVQGVRYFDAKPRHGMFLKQRLLSKVEPEATSGSDAHSSSCSESASVSGGSPAAAAAASVAAPGGSPAALASGRRQSIAEAINRISSDLTDPGRFDFEPIETHLTVLSRVELCETLWRLADRDGDGALDEEEFARAILAIDPEMDQAAASTMFQRLVGAVHEEACQADFLTPDCERMMPELFAELLNHEEGWDVSEFRLRRAIELLEEDHGVRSPAAAPRSPVCVAGQAFGGRRPSNSLVCGGLLRAARASRGWNLAAASVPAATAVRR